MLLFLQLTQILANGVRDAIPIKRDAIPIKRDAIPTRARRYPDEKRPTL